MTARIPLFKIHWDKRDVDRVVSVIEKGMHWAIGPEVREFEQKVAEYVGVEHAVAVNSGTSALHAALAAHGIGKGDEVIVPSFTFIATANAPFFVGATPVFADIEDETYGLDPEDVEGKITPRTKALIPIHYGGCPCRIEELRQIARQHNLVLVEDAAESLGAAVEGTRVGTFGDSAILSFCAPKVIATGEGGMVLTDSKDIYERVKLICNHGRAETDDYFSSPEQMEYVTLGYNFRMSTMTAALGVAQIEKIDEIVSMRRRNAHRLSERLRCVEGIRTPDAPAGLLHVYQLYTVRLLHDGDTRDRLMQHLVGSGVMAKVYFHPVHLTQFYRNEFGYRQGLLPVTERAASQVLTLPMYPALTDDEIDHVAQRVQDFFVKGAGS